MVPSHPTRVKFLFCLDPALWRAGPLAPQSHFAVPTMEGMAFVPLPVRTTASNSPTPTLRNTPSPCTAEGKAARFFDCEQRYRFATVARRRTGREGPPLYGDFGAGMTTFGTGRRREERQGTRPKPGVLTIKAGMWFCFKGIVLATPPSIKDSDGDPRGGAARPHPLERGAAPPMRCGWSGPPRGL
jgi:hypothetical protein